MHVLLFRLKLKWICHSNHKNNCKHFLKVEHKPVEDPDDQGEIVDDSFQRTVNSKDVKGKILLFCHSRFQCQSLLLRFTNYYHFYLLRKHR